MHMPHSWSGKKVLITAQLCLAARLAPSDPAIHIGAVPVPQSNQQSPSGVYDASVFEHTIPPDQLMVLRTLAGSPAGDVMHDKRFRKILHSVVPDCTFHYGRDMPLSEALDMVFKISGTPAQIRDGRYFTISGHSGPYLAGRGFLWIDLQAGIGLGGFFFHPTNGEPTPTLAVFSRQINEETLRMGQLPPAFAEDLRSWSENLHIPPITTRYFITGSNRRILLEHDENYCTTENLGSVPYGTNCQQMNADAADIDETAAYYLDKVNYRTNATAWMIGPDQLDWLHVRETTCAAVADPLGCRIRVTREHTHVILYRHAPPRQRGPH